MRYIVDLHTHSTASDGQYASADGPFVLRDAEGNITGRVNYYDDHTDNYLQINNQLLVNHRFNERWHMNLTGFYTYGYGFYKLTNETSSIRTMPSSSKTASRSATPTGPTRTATSSSTTASASRSART